ncbi:hypothetical protein [Leptobacterium sp. I13]|uniref:hypothetical protein n=1 Tax=Leptobacterium meishanense TaxID=3128904 RepID=UPI0030ED0541
MIRFFFFFSLLSLNIINAQHTVVNQTVTLSPETEQEFLFAAGKGDVIGISLNRKKGKVSEITLSEYPDHLVFSDTNVKKLHTSITATREGIYTLVVKNNHKKICSFSLNVLVNTSRNKPLTVSYKIERDTTYGYQTLHYRTIDKTVTESLQNEQFYLNSRSNTVLKGGKNRVILPVNLPENTVEWFYVFTASRNEDDIKNTLHSFDLAASLTKFIDNDKSLSSAVASLNAPPGANICDIYLLDEENTLLFNNKKDFLYEIDASRENYKSGVVEVKEVNGKKTYLGINNTDNIYGIHVAIEIVAIVKTQETIEEFISIPIITSYEIPIVK